MKAGVRRMRRPNMRRAVVLFPSGLTLGNLFFGVFAIIAASRGQFTEAGVYVLIGGACDALDGQVARATNAGTQFGEELDSLVDAITFGLAPGLIMYFAVLNRDNWDWLVVFLFAACAVLRLARFNIEQAGTAKTYFQGLPSPAAGITLASYYWFSQSWLYNYGAIADLPWHVLLRYLMAALAFLMVSNIPYPVFPRTGFRSFRAAGATLLLLGSIALLATRKLEYFFPFALCYVAWGPIRAIFTRLFERPQPTIPYDLSEGEDDDDEDEEGAFGPIDSQVHASRQSEREIRPPREERDRGPRPRADKPARSPRPDRPPRAESAASLTSSPASETTDRTTSGERAPRPDRPERSEAERAARREKRDKRDRKRERGPRADGPVADEPTESEVVIGTLDDSALGAIEAPILSVVRTETESAPSGETGERLAGDGAAPRKRKRRRRRGQRDRIAGDSTDGGDSGDANDSSDGGDADDDSTDTSNDGGGEANDSREAAPRSEASPRIEPDLTERSRDPAPTEPPERSPYSPSAATPSAPIVPPLKPDSSE